MSLVAELHLKPRSLCLVWERKRRKQRERREEEGKKRRVVDVAAV
jgi:hypothetical protein